VKLLSPPLFGAFILPSQFPRIGFSQNDSEQPLPAMQQKNVNIFMWLLRVFSGFYDKVNYS
jgi:hypothetical protein